MARRIGFKAAIKWIQDIRDVKIPAAIDDAVTSQQAIDEFQRLATEILKFEVYDQYPQSQFTRRRKNALLNSVEVVRTTNGIGIGLDPQKAPAKFDVPVNYGTYFLPEFGGGFLRNTIPEAIPRDFGTAWQTILADDVFNRLDAGLKRRVK